MFPLILEYEELLLSQGDGESTTSSLSTIEERSNWEKQLNDLEEEVALHLRQIANLQVGWSWLSFFIVEMNGAVLGLPLNRIQSVVSMHCFSSFKMIEINWTVSILWLHQALSFISIIWQMINSWLCQLFLTKVSWSNLIWLFHRFLLNVTWIAVVNWVHSACCHSTAALTWIFQVLLLNLLIDHSRNWQPMKRRTPMRFSGWRWKGTKVLKISMLWRRYWPKLLNVKGNQVEAPTDRPDPCRRRPKLFCLLVIVR